MFKMSHYFSTLELTRGLGIALLGSLFIYLDYWGISFALLETFTGLLALYMLLASNTKTWFVAGALSALFWFWWIVLSFRYYEMTWAMPIGLLVIMLTYGFIFAFIAKLSTLAAKCCKGSTSDLILLLTKAVGIGLLSYIHPFGFDWFKPELMFVQSYIGIDKWQLALLLGSMVISLWQGKALYLLMILLAVDTTHPTLQHSNPHIKLLTTYVDVDEKWDADLQPKLFHTLLQEIDHAIEQNYRIVVLPESVFPLFLNHAEGLLQELQKRATQITIITGALYHDGTTPRNSTYIFTKEGMQIAHKVLLVPFGESNPLPSFLSDWVNHVFYDDAVDYKAESNITDFTIDGTSYRNAICFEATSELLYAKDKEGKHPQKMIVLSNNGWFSPSIEPTLQKLLLLYYSRKYDTHIYHAVNMSPSYIIKP